MNDNIFRCAIDGGFSIATIYKLIERTKRGVHLMLSVQSYPIYASLDSTPPTTDNPTAQHNLSIVQ